MLKVLQRSLKCSQATNLHILLKQSAKIYFRGTGQHTLVTSATQLTRSDFNATVEESLTKWFKIFSNKEISEPLESIVNILAHTLNTNKISDVYEQRKRILSDVQIEKVNRMCQRRLESMPVQYIVGEWQFREITLSLQQPVFIPRPETELLVEHVANEIRKRNIDKIVELCCGSGAISLALLNLFPKLTAIAFDKSKAACELAEKNAERLGLKKRMLTYHADVTSTNNYLSTKYDIIVSNPPYVLSHEIKSLQPEILRYEDLDALDGGLDGLNVVKQIFTLSSGCLNPGGKIFMEVDPTHPEAIRSLLASDKSLKLRLLDTHKDLRNEPRFVEIIKT